MTDFATGGGLKPFDAVVREYSEKMKRGNQLMVALVAGALGLVFAIAAAQDSPKDARRDDPLRQAQSDLASGRLEKALENCRKAIELNPDSSSAYFLLGVIQEQRGAHQEARMSLIRSLKIEPSRVEAHILLGRIYLRSGQADEAGAEFKTALYMGDNSVKDANFGLGVVLHVKSQYKDALPYLTVALKAQPEDLLRLFSVAQAEIQLGLAEGVRTHLKKIDSISPGRVDIYYKLGMLLFQRSMPTEAETELRRAARLVEGSATRPPPEVSLPNVYLVLAKLRFGNNDYWGALRDLGHVSETAVPPVVHQEMALLAGKSLLGVGQSAQGLAKLKAVVQKDPSNASALLNLAWAALLAADPDLARESVRTLETKWPQDPQVGPMAALVQRESLPGRADIPLSQPWHLKGEGIVCCPCKVPCPCRSNGPPTEGHCESTGAYRIERGHYGKVRLDNFIFVTVSGAMESCSAPVSIFVTPSSTDEQLIALERIYQAFNPLRFVLFPSLKRVPILYTAFRNSPAYTVEIPGILQLKIERKLDREGRSHMRTAALDHFANTIEYARNVTYKSWEDTGGIQWDFSGRQANFRVIDLDAVDYSGGKMLMQFQDDAGFFNEKHLEIIRDLKLPMLPSYTQGIKP